MKVMAPETSNKAVSIVSSVSSSSISSLSSSSVNSLSTLSKVELDRLIAENMTSVLKSLKKRKHAKKHARIRQAAAEAAPVEVMDTMAEKKGQHGTRKKKPAQKEKKELNTVERRISPRKNHLAKDTDPKTAPLKYSLKEAQPKSKGESSGSRQTGSRKACNQQQQPVEKNGKENKTVNAFQLLMRARSKRIGSNSPGKNNEVVEVSPTQQMMRDEKEKRKLQLQEWAEQKGSAKRKLQDEAEGEYIEHQLKKRAKRLKKLIGNMGLEEEEVQENIPIECVSPEPPKSDHQRNKPATVCSNQSNHSKENPGKESGSRNKSATMFEIEIEETIKMEDDSNDEFLSQLSSPRKKKDSLLGYFNKVPDRKKTYNSPPQTRHARKGNQPIVDVEESKLDTQRAETSRPRRSCANRIKDYAAFERFSPEKVEPKSTQSKNTPIVTPLKIINVQSPNTMKVVRSPSLRMFSSNGATAGPVSSGNGNATSSTEWPTTPKSVKLAPVFSKGNAGGKQPPTVIDPEKARARQLFLMSGIPEKMRQEIEKRTAYEEYVLNESPVFPLVSHVTQLEQDETESSGSSGCSRKVDFKRSCIKLRPAQIESPARRGSLKSVKSRKIRFGLFTECSPFDYEDALIKCVESTEVEETDHELELPEIANVKEIVRDYKQRYQHFPVFKCYKQFRTIYQDHQLAGGDGSVAGEKSQPLESSSKQLPRSKWSDRNGETKALSISMEDSVEIIEPIHKCRNGELLFTEKYKPHNTEQILVNYVPATLLKRFLSSWQEDGAGLRRMNNGGPAQLNGDYFTGGNSSFDDEFDLSNGSTSTSATGSGSATGICNHVVLVGPPGCGKTCNVYAVAKEMHFNVLEINASSRRKGKIILQELLEATQSHQVRQKTERSNSIDVPLFRKKGGSDGGGKKPGLLNGTFSCLERRPSFSETNGNGSKKLSLILIEDADIVFEQDDGFLGAINQLVATSKRPIVLTTTNPSCAHMARYMTRSNVISYVAPGIANVAKLLSLLALVERIPIDQHDLGRLYAYNGKDMRKTLNELQFFIQSGGDMVRYLPTNGAGGEFDSPEHGEALDGELNETRNEEHELPGMGEESSRSSANVRLIAKRAQHGTLYQLFTRNQNEEMVLRLPLDFDTLWCNMELVLREAKTALAVSNHTKDTGYGKKKRLSTPKRQRRQDVTSRLNASTLSSEILLDDEMCFLYENISRAEAGWAATQRNRIRYGRDVQDEQHQQQMANEIGHALVEGSWIEWFDRRRVKNGRGKTSKAKGYGDNEPSGGAKAYDGLRKFEQEQRQTITSHIGVNGIRSRVTACDYEPLLRQICRYERNRLSQERRGTRFYHYLRNFAASNAVLGSTVTNMAALTANGFSADHFDALSQRFEEQEPLSLSPVVDEEQVAK